MVISNSTEELIVTGNAFIIEKWNGNKWMKEKGVGNRIFTDIGYTIKPGENKIFETDIVGYYPNLGKGTYKISKSFFYEKDIPINKYEEHWISQEFKLR